jgi:hypothetical protein
MDRTASTMPSSSLRAGMMMLTGGSWPESTGSARSSPGAGRLRACVCQASTPSRILVSTNSPM